MELKLAQFEDSITVASVEESKNYISKIAF